MLIWRLWNYINGYVIIIVEGYFLEKFINICTHRNIRLWNVKWQKNSRVSMKLSIADYKQIRPVVRKTRCKVHITKRKGVPFILNRYRNRKAFVIGSVVCIIAFFLISSFVWDISVYGNTNVSTESILERLKENGIENGVLKFKVNTDEVAENMMLQINDLARISVVLKGTRVYVDVTERTKPPVLIDRRIPCNIVAARDGVIYSIVAKEGLETVKVGDTVTKGQLLITGKIDNVKNPELPPLIVHSIGSVKARTWYEATAKVEQNLVTAKRTGMKKEQYSLILFSRKFKLFHGKIPYNNSEHVEVKKKLTLGANFALPFEMLVDEYYEYELENNKIDVATAKKLASEKAVELAQKQIPMHAEVLKKNIVEYEDENGKAVRAIIECIEDIGITQEIGGM
ncbi:putative stage IV sporulation protein YqfD [Ruminiclostridium hungatei]|uniref:Putative stage IV sporulation protein YqfD n=1 Tax=Ruminiclostridium hungatei TaxID=48256 RepID=A0A1V4ST14_RUMHU|nr:sporulation protein YqfD [Ruminiclostridium hungatei]OPX46441.1 putative stage IV sporulation protein YqfD [Ruminiclostridium hungatei]